MSKLTKEMAMKLHNRFDIEVIDARTGKTRQTARALNIICDTFFKAIFGQLSGGATYISVGSGSTTPAVTDTTLANRTLTKASSSDVYSIDKINKIVSKRLYINIGTQEIVNTDISEIGLSDSSGTIYTHALLQDMNGNPITIHKTDTDIINIYATINLHYTESNGVRVGARGGIIDAILRAAQLHTGGITFKGTGGHRRVNIRASTQTGEVYLSTRNNDYSLKKLEWSGRMLNTSGTEVTTGMQALMSENFLIEYLQDYVLTGESVGTGDGSTTKFKTKFSFPRNATVYVNGVAQTSGVTVKKLPSRTIRIGSGQSVITGPSCTFSNLIQIDPASTLNNILPIIITDEGYYYNYYCQSYPCYMYNPMYDEGEGIKGGEIFNSGQWYGSNDLENWTQITNFSNDLIYKFFRHEGSQTYASGETQDGYNIIFDTPPAVGDVITIDYTTNYIPKDLDHVMDITFSITLGEYVEE